MEQQEQYQENQIVDKEQSKKKSRSGFAGGVAVGVLASGSLFAVMLAILIQVIVSNGAAYVSQPQASLTADSALITRMDEIKQLIDLYSLNPLEESALIDGVSAGMIAGLKDQYSAYYTAENFKKLTETVTGTYKGIGITVQYNSESGEFTVQSVVEDGPAAKAGMQTGDILHTVNGNSLENFNLDQLIEWIQNNESDQIQIQVLREGESEPITLDITRENMETATVAWEMLDDQIGYIAVSVFDLVTVQQFQTAIDTLQAQGMKGLVIDLRDNPGGVYEAVVSMLDYILPEGLLIYMEDKNGNGDKAYSDAEHQLTVPYAVIINENSASASEAFAGSVKDYGIGKVVGTTSFGKGVAQKLIPLSDGSAIRITTDKYYTKSGTEINGVGIQPDIEVELPEGAAYGSDEDTQLKAAIEAVK